MRYEFPKPVKRFAVARAKSRCEAVGEVYGLPAGERCNADLGRGFEIDHYPVPATERGSDVLENAVVCCKQCHGFKTRTFDIPVQAKVKRVRDKDTGVARPKHRWGNRPLGTGNHQHTATRPVRRKNEV